MRIPERIHFYNYLDIIDSRNKMDELEQRGKKEDKYSWSILVDDLKNRIIDNVLINDFIKKINKNIIFSNIYYNTINKYIDDTMEEVNKENDELFHELKRYMFLYYLDDKDFYLLQKRQLFNEMMIITKIYNKINNSKNPVFNVDKLNDFICEKLEIFEKRKNVIYLINKKIKKELISNEDDIIINIKNEDDIIVALDFMNNNKKIYNNVKLPDFIKIREYNNYYPLILNYENTIKKNIYYINIIIYNYMKYNKIKNNKNIFYVNNDLYNNRSSGLDFKSNNYINTIYLNRNQTGFCFILILIINIYKFLHYFDRWRKKHKPRLIECGV